MYMQKLTWVLVIIGGLNWLLVGLVGWDIGMLFGGSGAMISKIIYVLVGVSAIYQIFAGRKSSGMGGHM